ncbi:dihydroorotate dehydrogenase electron transfer subunit [candidate division WOR-3 bacterium]|nr:dihydroorotate dehydrogenase electron transfer subunit [candidate division WOR-3 bacterium]
MRPVLAPVRRVRPLRADVLSVWLRAPALARSVKAGQFLNVTAGEAGDMLLRRPISVADVEKDEVRLVFRVVGRGTAALARARPGDVWDVLGPLGRPAAFPRGREVLLIGGGVGTAPLLLLARRAASVNRVRVFAGARTRRELILVPEFEKLGVPVLVATDDGSQGFKGTVTELAEGEVGRLKSAGRRQSRGPVMYACGPHAMLADLARRLPGMDAWGFFEERMGCGTGICYCCALPRKAGGYIRFCKEGPVVRLNEAEL